MSSKSHVPCAFVAFLMVVRSALGDVFSPSPSASTGTLPEGSGQALYGNYGVGADGANPPADTYNIYRKYTGIDRLTAPDTDLHTLDPEQGNPTSAIWSGLNQGGTPGTGMGFDTGFKAPGMFVGTSPSTSTYEDQLLNFGPVIDVGALPDGNFNGDSSNRRQWELRVGFLEDPEAFIDDNAPNGGDMDLWHGSWMSDGVSMNIFIGSNDEGGQTGNSNWFTSSQFNNATGDVPNFMAQSGAADTAIADEPGRDALPLTAHYISTGEELEDLSGHHDAGVDYNGRIEMSWWMELNNPDAAPGSAEAREVKMTAKVGNVIYEGLFDPGDANNPIIPNTTNDPTSAYTDGFFDWQNATPVFYLGAHNQTAPGAAGVQGVFVPGDFDASGAINDDDLSLWEANKYGINKVFAAGDGTQDGLTDVRDLIGWSGAVFGSSGNSPQFVYNPENGELALNGGGVDVHAFSVEVDPDNVVSVTNANLPNADTGWDVQNFGGAVQGNDITLSEDGATNGATGNHVIATLATGLTAGDFGKVSFADSTGSGLSQITIGGVGPACDFNGDGVCDIVDLDELLYTGLGTVDPKYDLDGSGVVTLDDRDEFLRQINSFPGDFDLNGQVVAGDLNILGGNWQQTELTSWAQGDSNGDGLADARDLNDLGANWQQGAAANAVPEPAGWALAITGLLAFISRRRSQR